MKTLTDMLNEHAMDVMWKLGKWLKVTVAPGQGFPEGVVGVLETKRGNVEITVDPDQTEDIQYHVIDDRR